MASAGNGIAASLLSEAASTFWAFTTPVHFDLARKIKPEIILFAHGAGLVNPEDAQFVIERTACHGVQVGSSIERMAIEKPLEERVGIQKGTFP
jgi:predicted TIM-barrel enzyme